jgi:hypothetical protein
MIFKYLVKLSLSTRYTALVSLALMALILMYDHYVAPHVKYLSTVQGYESAMTKFVNKNKFIDKKVEIKKKKLEELREKSALLESTLFSHDKAREFFSDLQAIAEQTGCMVQSLNMLKQNPKDKELEESSGIVAKSAMLSVVGLYPDIPKLIKRLQARTQKVWIDSIKIVTLAYNSDKPRCDIIITICEVQDKGDTR